MTAHPGAGAATLEVVDLPLLDFGDIVNALTGATPPTPATVSFRVEWSGVESRVKVRDTTNDFEAQLIRNQARMEWTATSGDFTFASAALATSTSSFAETGHERNGAFFPHA